MALKTSQLAMNNENDWNYCDRCEKTEAPNCKCLDCDEVLCDECKRLHMLARKYKTHRMISYTDRNKECNSKSNSFCKEHPINKIIMCCATCQKPACEECLHTGHKKHEFKMIKIFAEEKSKELIEDARKKINVFRKTHHAEGLRIVDYLETDIQSRALKACTSCDDTTKMIAGVLEEVCGSAKGEINDKEKKACSVIKAKKRMIESNMKEILSDLSKYEETLKDYDNYVVQNFDKQCIKFNIRNPEELQSASLADKVPENVELKILETFLQRLSTRQKSWLECEASNNAPYMVAAIYFGSTLSGNAISTKHGDLRFIKENGCSSDFNTAAILLKPDKTFHSYGNEATMYYSQLSNNGGQEGWLFIKDFPLKVFTDNAKCSAGLDELAPTIYELSIKYYIDLVLEMFGKALKVNEISWVIVVPSFIGDEQRQVVTKAANRAGIYGDLMVISDAVTVSTYCREFPVDRLGGNELSFMAFLPGSKQLILHLEYEAAYFTVLEVCRNHQYNQIHTEMISCGSGICKQIEEFFTECVGNEKMKEIRKDPDDYNHMMEEFKHRIKVTVNDTKNDVRFHVHPLRNCIKDLNLKIDSLSEMFQSINLPKAGGVSINHSLFKSFFDEVVTEIVTKSEAVIKKEEVKYIIMTGELAESRILQRKIRCSFPKLTVLIPPDPGSAALLKGAVLYVRH